MDGAAFSRDEGAKKSFRVFGVVRWLNMRRLKPAVTVIGGSKVKVRLLTSAATVRGFKARCGSGNSLPVGAGQGESEPACRRKGGVLARSFTRELSVFSLASMAMEERAGERRTCICWIPSPCPSPRWRGARGRCPILSFKFCVHRRNLSINISAGETTAVFAFLCGLLRRKNSGLSAG